MGYNNVCARSEDSTARMGDRRASEVDRVGVVRELDKASLYMTEQLLCLSPLTFLTWRATRAASVKASLTPRFFMAEHSALTVSMSTQSSCFASETYQDI